MVNLGRWAVVVAAGHGVVVGGLTWQVRVPEDVPPGTTVIRVRARDRDLGLNGAVEYSFSPLTEAQHGAVFGIRPDTGKIYVKAVGLDHEQSAVRVNTSTTTTTTTTTTFSFLLFLFSSFSSSFLLFFFFLSSFLLYSIWKADAEAG